MDLPMILVVEADPVKIKDGLADWSRRVWNALEVGRELTMRTETGDTTLGPRDDVLIMTGGSVLTLCAPLSVQKRMRFFKNLTGGGVDLTPTAPVTVDGAATVTIADGASVAIITDGANWFTL